MTAPTGLPGPEGRATLAPMAARPSARPSQPASERTSPSAAASLRGSDTGCVPPAPKERRPQRKGQGQSARPPEDAHAPAAMIVPPIAIERRCVIEVRPSPLGAGPWMVREERLVDDDGASKSPSPIRPISAGLVAMGLGQKFAPPAGWSRRAPPARETDGNFSGLSQSASVTEDPAINNEQDESRWDEGTRQGEATRPPQHGVSPGCIIVSIAFLVRGAVPQRKRGPAGRRISADEDVGERAALFH